MTEPPNTTPDTMTCREIDEMFKRMTPEDIEALLAEREMERDCYGMVF